MHWALSILIGLLTAVAACFGAGFVASLCARWYRVSSFEGASGYYVVFLALLGGIVGLIAGIVCSRIVAARPDPSFVKGLGLALASVLMLLACIGGLARLGADITPSMDGCCLELAVEVRGPEGFKVPTPDEKYAPFAEIYVPHRRGLPTGKLLTGETEVVEGRLVVAATVPLSTSARSKYLRVYFSRENDVTFPLPLRAHPGKADLEWSRWITSAWDAGSKEPPPEKKFGMRFRVRKIELRPSHGPTPIDGSQFSSGEPS